MAVSDPARKLTVHYDPVLDLRVFVLGKHVPGHELVAVGVWALSDNAVRLSGCNAWKGRQIVLRCLVEVDGPLAAQPVFESLGNRLAVAFDSSGFFSRFLTNLIGTLIGAGGQQT